MTEKQCILCVKNGLSYCHWTYYHRVLSKNTATLLQALTASKTEHCHIGTGTDITKNRALPHWYRHSQYQKQCRPVLISYTNFVHNIFEGINSEHFFTCFYAVNPEAHPPSCTDVTMASVLHVVSLFLCVILSWIHRKASWCARGQFYN
jgi:hypothetical protein